MEAAVAQRARLETELRAWLAQLMPDVLLEDIHEWAETLVHLRATTPQRVVQRLEADLAFLNDVVADELDRKELVKQLLPTKDLDPQPETPRRANAPQLCGASETLVHLGVV